MSKLDIEAFAIDGVQFVIDNRPGVARGKSAIDRFVLVKTQDFIEFYRALAAKKFKAILELGMFEGGSLVLFDKLFKPEKIVGVDIRKEPIEPLEAYRGKNPQVLTYYGLSQADDFLSGILAECFPAGIDLIVDDASHLYEFTKRSFELCFPHLRPGGLYIIEDWAWSHKPHRQHAGDPWSGKPAMTNVLFELTLLTTCTNWIKSVTIHRDMVVVEKSGASPSVIDANSYNRLIRGKSLTLI